MKSGHIYFEIQADDVAPPEFDRRDVLIPLACISLHSFVPSRLFVSRSAHRRPALFTGGTPAVG